MTVPPRRVDVEAEVDLIEEIARSYGYDRIEGERMCPAVPGGPPSRDYVRLDRLRDFLVSLGGLEAVSTSLLSLGDIRAMGWGEDDPRGQPVSVLNPLVSEESCLRTSLLPGLLKCVRANQNFRAPGGFLWEIGRVFFGSPGDLPVEAVQLALASYGTLVPATWAQGEVESSFYRMKGAIEAMLALMGVTNAEFLPGAGMPFHPGKSARIVAGGSLIGEVGEIHPAVEKAMDLSPCVAAWFSVEALLCTAKEVVYSPVSRFMPVERDLAVIVDEAVPAGEVIDAVRASGEDLASVTLFDVYRKAPVPEGKKSLAMRLVFQPMERTLTEEELTERREKILLRLKKDFGAIPRG